MLTEFEAHGSGARIILTFNQVDVAATKTQLEGRDLSRPGAARRVIRSLIMDAVDESLTKLLPKIIEGRVLR